jgi:RHS repeat-associated protein
MKFVNLLVFIFLSLSSCVFAQDAFEPDNIPSLNNPSYPDNPGIFDGVIQTHNFHQANESDWGLSWMGPNGVLEFRFAAVTNPGYDRWRAELYMSEDGSPLRTLVAQGAFGATSLKLRGQARPAAGRLFWVHVTPISPTFFGAGSEYTLLGSIIPGTSPDVGEPNDAPELSNPGLLSGISRTFNFNQTNDADWAITWLTATSVADFTFAAVTPTATDKWYAQLYMSEDGSTVRTAVSAGSFGQTTLTFRGQAKQSAGRLFWVKVTAIDGNFVGNSTSYSVTATTQNGVNPDAFEADDQASYSNPNYPDNPGLLSGVTQVHNFNQTNDHDWAIFWLGAGQSASVRLAPNVANASSPWRTQIFYSEEGTTSRQLANDDVFGAQPVTFTAAALPAAGRLFWVHVYPVTNNFVGAQSQYSILTQLISNQPTLTATPNTALIAPANTTLSINVGTLTGITSVTYFNGATPIACAIGAAPSYSCAWANIAAGIYQLTVQIVANGQSIASPVVALTVGGTALPCIPTAAAPATSSVASFTVSWTNAPGCPTATTYELRTGTGASGPWNSTTTASTSALVNAPTNTTYFSNVRACIGATCSAFSSNVQTLVNANQGVNGEVLYFHHTNAIGSVVATTDAVGNIVNRQHFRPFGTAQNRAGAPTNDQGFTGKRFDPVLGLNYYGARYYDPQISRFISIDPADFSTDDLQSFGRYQYVTNNPLTNIDLDGRESATMAYESAMSLAQANRERFAAMSPTERQIAASEEKNILLVMVAVPLMVSGVGEVAIVARTAYGAYKTLGAGAAVFYLGMEAAPLVEATYVEATTGSAIYIGTGGLARANAARDAELAVISKLSKTQQSKITTVVAAYDPLTDQIAVGVKQTLRCNSNMCAEDLAAKALNYAKNLIFTEAKRPRGMKTIPMCPRCKAKGYNN